MKLRTISARIVISIILIVVYLQISIVLFDFDFMSMVNANYIVLVTLGIGLLALSQFKPGIGWIGLIKRAINSTAIAGALTTLFAVMQALEIITIDATIKPTLALARALLPMLYAIICHSILAAIETIVELNVETKLPVETKVPVTLDINGTSPQFTKSNLCPNAPTSLSTEIFAPEVVYRIMTQQGFTSREIHVALKLFENKSNKDIAADLFISEATVKKHIQNMFKKCRAKNRQDLLISYLKWLETGYPQ